MGHIQNEWVAQTIVTMYLEESPIIPELHQQVMDTFTGSGE